MQKVVTVQRKQTHRCFSTDRLSARCGAGQHQQGSGLEPPALPVPLPPDFIRADSTKPTEPFFSFPYQSGTLLKICVFFTVFQMYKLPLNEPPEFYQPMQRVCCKTIKTHILQSPPWDFLRPPSGDSCWVTRSQVRPPSPRPDMENLPRNAKPKHLH